jgi:3-mercaptopyruvate sulfurtransferase SseA
MQTPAAQRRKRLASGLIITAVLLVAGPLVADLFAPDLPWLLRLAGVLPVMVFTIGIQVWHRADKVFDRGFEPEDAGDKPTDTPSQ